MILFLTALVSVALADDLVIERITGKASDIQLVRPEGSKQVPAVGARAPQGSRVITGAEVSVQVRLPEGSSVAVGRDTEAAFHVLGQSLTEIALEQGRARAKVPKNPSGARRFHFKTKTATMGVRGTDFTVELKGETVSVHVLDGSVEVTRAVAANPDFVLAPNQAVDVGAKPSPSEQPRTFDPKSFLLEWEAEALPELHWWQRLWRWITGLFA